MKEELISFETAKLAKEKGFYYSNCNSYWTEGETTKLSEMTPWYEFPEDTDRYLKYPRYFAPTQSLLQKWLREKHDINVESRTKISSNGKYYNYYINCTFYSERFDSYEEALEKGLFEALNLIK